MKIPKKYDQIIFQKYSEYLERGYPITKIADLVNEDLGTDFPESSLRGRYQKMKISSSDGIDDYELEQKLFKIARQELKVKETQKVVVRQRAMVDARAREYSDKLAVESVIEKAWSKTPSHYTEVTKRHVPDGEWSIIYSYGDVHWGYEYNHSKFTYNTLVAYSRLEQMFQYIRQDVLENGYTSIIIADLGDQIEGASLRVSQLLRVAEAMTVQAKQYSEAIKHLIKWLSAELPHVKIKFCMVSEDNHAQLRTFSTKRDELPENLAMLITNNIQTMVDTAHEFGGLANVEFIHGDEIVLTIEGGDTPYNVAMSHGHQYGKGENLLDKLEQRHETSIHLGLFAHWHQFSVKYKNVKDGGQQALMFMPSVVGDTDFSERLFLSCYPGFVKIHVNTTYRMSNARAIRLK